MSQEASGPKPQNAGVSQTFGKSFTNANLATALNQPPVTAPVTAPVQSAPQSQGTSNNK